jgi:ABC-type transport system involved in multi-copper enzyme maturation permease subunit
MPTIIRFVLLTAMRDRLFAVLVLLLFVGVGISSGLAKTSMIEQHEMMLSFSGAVARLLLAIGLIVFVCFHIRHSFDSKEIDVLLSRPISRAGLVIGYWLGFSMVTAALVAINAAVLFLLSPLSVTGFATWVGSLLLEMWLVVAIALFAAVTLRSAVSSVMASLVFYVAGRMMGFFLATIQSRFVFEEPWLNAATKAIIEGVAIITPRLDLYSKSGWLVYGPSTADWQLFVMQSVSFIPLLLAVTILDFKRRQF